MSFLDKLVPKNQKCQFRLKFGTSTSKFEYAEFIGADHFFYFRPETLFGQIWFKKSLVSLSWNMVPTLIQICRIQWWCSLFLIFTGNTYFGKRRGTKRDYCFCHIMRVETWKKAAVVNKAFLFCWDECVRALFLGTVLNKFK